MMRQAGRYLPEFRDIRAANHFFEVCQKPRVSSRGDAATAAPVFLYFLFKKWTKIDKLLNNDEK